MASAAHLRAMSMICRPANKNLEPGMAQANMLHPHNGHAMPADLPCGVDCNRFDAEFPAGTQDAYGYLTAVGD